jgi:hypothetical protein
VNKCFVIGCDETATVEGIGTHDGVCGIVETVALCLCERHAAALRNEVLVLATS